MRNQFDIEKNRINQEDLFEVPENYFQNLEKNILGNTIEKQGVDKDKGKVFNLKRYVWPIAASLILGVGLSLWYFRFNVTNEEVDYLSEISNEEIIEYLEYEDVGYQVYSYYEEQDVSLEQENFPDLELSDSEINEYLELSDLEEIYL